MSGASYIRKFVREHQLYKQDSEVPIDIVTDLLNNIQEIIQRDESELMLGKYLDFLTGSC